MITTTSNTSNVVTSVTGGAWFGVPCALHGMTNCNCSTLVNNTVAICISCRQSHNSSSLGAQHICGGGTNLNTWGGSVPYVTGTTTGLNGTNWVTTILLKELKEITTDSELTYDWNDGYGAYDLKLPAKFGDCFLKVGNEWSSLYPLIFSAYEHDAKELSFHIVVGISDKAFDGDKVVLKSANIAKISDNLTLLQLTQRVRDFFKEDDKTNSTLQPKDS